jgi:hypothetical protein
MLIYDSFASYMARYCQIWNKGKGEKGENGEKVKMVIWEYGKMENYYNFIIIFGLNFE